MSIIRQVTSSPFLRNNAIYFIGSFTAAALNYLYYPVLGRLMNLAHFGETQLLVSLFMQLTIFFTVTIYVIANIVANAEKSKETDETLEELQRLMVLVALFACGITALLAGFIKDFFKFESALPIYALAIALLVTMPLTIRVAYLRGKQVFGAVTLSGMISAGAKLIFSTLLVYLGTETFGAIFGIALAQVLALAYTGWMATKLGFIGVSTPWLQLPQIRLIKKYLKYSAFAILITLVITVQSSIDIFIVKRFFDPDTAGLYSGIATVAKIIFFLTASISAVLFSSVKLRDELGTNLQLLLKSVLFLVVLGGGALAFFSLWPEFVIGLLMGERYLSVAQLLPSMSLAIFAVSLLNLVLTYFMALRRYQVVIPVVIGAVITYLLLGFNHNSLEQVVQNLLGGTLSLLGMVAGWAGWRILSSARLQRLTA